MKSKSVSCPAKPAGGRGVDPVADLEPTSVSHGSENAIGIVPAGRVRTGTIALLDVLPVVLAKERHPIEFHRLRVFRGQIREVARVQPQRVQVARLQVPDLLADAVRLGTVASHHQDMVTFRTHPS